VAAAQIAMMGQRVNAPAISRIGSIGNGKPNLGRTGADCSALTAGLSGHRVGLVLNEQSGY
jgi:hypothetical protein